MIMPLGIGRQRRVVPANHKVVSSVVLKDVVAICPGEEGNVGRGELAVGEKGRAGCFFELLAEGSQPREQRLERGFLLLLVCLDQHSVVWAAALSVDLLRARVSTLFTRCQRER